MATKPRSEEPGANVLADALKQDRLRARFVLDLVQVLGWHENLVLRGISINRSAEGWRCVLRACRHRRPVVCFINGETYTATIEHLCYAIEHGLLTWFDDKYAQADTCAGRQ